MTSTSREIHTGPEGQTPSTGLPGAPAPDPHAQALSIVARHRVGSAVAGVIVLSCLLRASVLGGSWFGGDDFVFYSRAHQLGFSWQTLHLNYTGQYMPGALALAAFNEAVSPLGWGLVLWEALALQALAGLTFWRLLRTVFVPTPWLLLPLALYLVSPVTLAATTWWAAALNTLPLLVVLPLALTSHVQLLRTGRRRHALATAGWLALGLAFFVKAVLIAPLLVVLTLGLRGSAGAPESRRAAFWRCRVLWLALVGVFAGYAALYLSAPASQPGGGVQVPRDLGQLVELYRLGFGSVVLPGLLGGPWRWIGVDGPTALSEAPAAAQVVSAALVLGGILALCLVRQRAWLIWVAAALYLCGDLAFVAVGRLNLLDAVLARETHYLADGLPVLWLAVTFCFFRLPDEPARAFRWERLRLPVAVRAHPRGAVLALGAGVLASSVGSTVTYAHDRFSREPARSFVETARGQLALAPADLRLYDRKVPTTLMAGLFGDGALASQVLAPVMPGRLAASSWATAAEDPQVFDDAGRLRRVGVAGVQLRTGPDKGCGWRVAGTSRTLPWNQPVGAFGGAVRIGYLAASPTEATLRQGETTVTARLHPGLGQVVFPARGPAGALTVTVPPHGVVCVGDAQFGDVVLLP